MRFLPLVLTALLFGCSTLPLDEAGNILLDVYTHPPGATVTLPTGEQAQTPTTFSIPPGTSVVLRIELEGYEPAEVNVAPSGRAADNYAMITGGLVGFLVSDAKDKELALVPSPVGVELVPIGETLAQLPEGRDWVGVFASCSTPFDVGEDCSYWTGPERVARVHAHEMLISGSDESGGVLVKPYQPDPAEFEFDRVTFVIEPCTRVYRAALDYGAKLVRAVEHRASPGGGLIGCYLQFDQPVYSHLKTMTIEARD